LDVYQCGPVWQGALRYLRLARVSVVFASGSAVFASGSASFCGP
jgi:hypothetical protein